MTWQKVLTMTIDITYIIQIFLPTFNSTNFSLFAFFHDKDGNPLTPRGDDGKPPINRRLQVRQWSDNTILQVT